MFKITDDIVGDVLAVKRQVDADKIFLLTDDIVRVHCLPMSGLSALNPVEIVIPAGEQSKSIDGLRLIWDFLIDRGATRHSLLLNLGGGMITDLGGFAAVTFKRGIPFVNIPTTILAAVDAAFGGKTGIDYLGLKNEIGCFAAAKAVLVCPKFFTGLDIENRFSGYAEMVKHALLSDVGLLSRTLSFDFDTFPIEQLTDLLEANHRIKQHFIELDPREKGIRKALNLGHTFGHAFEALSISTGRPILHGTAVMWGLVAELYLSVLKLGLDKTVLLSSLTFAKENYGAFPFSCKQYDAILDLMAHDKKNSHDNINFTLLAAVGDIRINRTATRDEIVAALDFVREN